MKKTKKRTHNKTNKKKKTKNKKTKQKQPTFKKKVQTHVPMATVDGPQGHGAWVEFRRVAPPYG